MSWFRRTRESAPPAPAARDDDSASCSFCHLPRAEVAWLIAGEGVMICDRCIALCTQVIDGERERKHGASYHADVLLHNVETAGATAPHAWARPRLRAAIELTRHPESLRRVWHAGFLINDHATALAAINAIPIEARTVHDALNAVVSLYELARSAEALTVLDAIDTAGLADVTWILYRLHRALVELDAGATDPAIADAHLRAAEDFAELVDTVPSNGTQNDLRAERFAVITLASLALGRLNRAERAARAWLELHPQSPDAHAFLARVLLADGDTAGADAALAELARHRHPDDDRDLLRRAPRSAAPST